jgi:hypothetical protein
MTLNEKPKILIFCGKKPASLPGSYSHKQNPNLGAWCNAAGFNKILAKLRSVIFEAVVIALVTFHLVWKFHAISGQLHPVP